MKRRRLGRFDFIGRDATQITGEAGGVVSKHLTFAASEAPSYSPRHASGSESATARRGQSVLLVDPLIVSRYWATSF